MQQINIEKQIQTTANESNKIEFIHIQRHIGLLTQHLDLCVALHMVGDHGLDCSALVFLGAISQEMLKLYILGISMKI